MTGAQEWQGWRCPHGNVGSHEVQLLETELRQCGARTLTPPADLRVEIGGQRGNGVWKRATLAKVQEERRNGRTKLTTQVPQTETRILKAWRQ